MDKTLIDLGIFEIKWYSFFILIAMIVACIVILPEAKNKKLKEDTLIDIIFYGIIIGLIGARIYYVLFNLDYYLSNPIEIFMVWNGGLAIHGGIIAALIFLIIYTRKKKINLLLLLDILVVGLIIAQAIGRWGNFFNQEAYGGITSLETLQALHLPKFIINGMNINGYYRIPTFLLESVISFVGFLILLILRKLKKLHLGQLTGIYLIWYGIERFIVEGLRTDSLMLGPIRIAQLVSIIALIIGMIIVIKQQNTKKLYKETNFIKN